MDSSPSLAWFRPKVSSYHYHLSLLQTGNPSDDLSRRPHRLRGGDLHLELKRSLEEMVGLLTRELAIPEVVFLMTGNAMVPPDKFTLNAVEVVRIEGGELVLDNGVES